MLTGNCRDTWCINNKWLVNYIPWISSKQNANTKFNHNIFVQYTVILCEWTDRKPMITDRQTDRQKYRGI
jgi:hypothetical protein